MKMPHTLSSYQSQNSFSFIKFWHEQGRVKTGFLAPGFRCAPFYQVMQEFPSLQLFSVLDERAMAFQALGWAREARMAPLIACTSGTAGANFYPAIIEAYQSRIPLIVVTCDRPDRLRGSDSSQTIDQIDLFGKYVSFHDSFKMDEEGASVDGSLREALDLLISEQRPIHFNLSFEDPSFNQEKRA